MRTGYAFGLLVATAIWTLTAGSAHAQSCGESYTVVSGDSLSRIAKQSYQDGTEWSLIYYVNKGVIGEDPSLIFPGQKLRIPCPGSDDVAEQTSPPPAEQKPAPAETVTNASVPSDAAAAATQVTLLTADDYRPFTDRGLPHGGMITDIVRSALDGEQQDANGPGFNIAWVNDWAAHLNPLLSNGAFDMGFPWFRPNCERYDELDEPAKFRCDTFHFSEPVFEILVLFFTRNDGSFQFSSDDQVVGKRLCRPSGYFTFDLDKDGRNWVKDEKITLLRPDSVEECFKLLARGEVDAVALNEFTGREAVTKLSMSGDVRTIERPVSVLNLHVIVPKQHPRADALLGHVNQALQRIRKSGKYGEIVERHLSVFWKSQGSG